MLFFLNEFVLRRYKRFFFCDYDVVKDDEDDDMFIIFDFLFIFSYFFGGID